MLAEGHAGHAVITNLTLNQPYMLVISESDEMTRLPSMSIKQMAG
jgi:hypothetical protein